MAGEHSVLRGGTAIVFPLKSRFIEWSYHECAEHASDLGFKFQGIHGAELEILVLGLLEKAFENLGISKNKVCGRVQVFSNLPLGAGLGASAALCVSVSRWLKYLGFLNEAELFPFSKKLEDLFHGESSGVDVAVSLSGHPLLFSREFGSSPLSITWQPQIALSYSGHRGMTKDCVEKVKKFFESDALSGKKIDAQMKSAVESCRSSLTQEVKTHEQQQKAMEGLMSGIREAKACFEDWGLVDQSLENEMNLLLKRGALAVKPTGSGGGGYVLSLWDKDIPSDLLGCF